MKTKIPADLVTINCNNVEEGIKALNFSSRDIEFENIILFTDKNVKGDFNKIDIDEIKGVSQYNDFILNLNQFINSQYVLIVQDDGHVLSPEKWTNDFLNYDYIGAPWPNNKKWNKRWDKYEKKYRDKIKQHSKENRIGNGGFSLRSKKFLEYSSIFSSTEILAEDIFLNLYNYDLAIDFDIKYPDLDLAINFSYETTLVGRNLRKESKHKNYRLGNHFGWHGKKFKNTKELLDLKND